MGRPVSFDFTTGGGSPEEFLMGVVYLEPTLMHTVGSTVVLPDAPYPVKLVNGKAVHPNVAVSPAGPEPAWAYKVTIENELTGKAWSEFRGVPTGTTQIAYKELPKFITTIPPQTTAGMMQNWADTTEANADRSELAADRAEAPTDEMNKNLIEDPASLTATALSTAIDDQTKVKLGAEVLTGPLTIAALQSAANLAAENGRTLYASGTITTDQTLVITSDTELGALTYNYTGQGIAVRVGSFASSLFRRKGTLPRVLQTGLTGSGTWVDSKIGIQMVNNDSCVWLVPHVQNFGVGLDEVGENRGHAYNTITIGHLANNKVNNQLSAVGTGWANQNTHIGGRFGHNSSEGVNTPGTRHVHNTVADVNIINTNTWVGSSFEGETAEFHADTTGIANMFINCRWECPGGARVRWGVNSVNNQILYGYQAGGINQTHSEGSARNQIFSSDRIILPVGSGTIIESSSSLAAAVETMLEPGGIKAGVDPATAYVVKRAGTSTHMKRAADLFDRLRMDHLSGRVYAGPGTSEPDKYFGAVGSRLGIGGVAVSTSSPVAGGAGALPATPKGYFELVVNGVVGLIPYY